MLCGGCPRWPFKRPASGDTVSPAAHFHDSARRGWEPAGVRDLDLFSHPAEAGSGALRVRAVVRALLQPILNRRPSPGDSQGRGGAKRPPLARDCGEETAPGGEDRRSHFANVPGLLSWAKRGSGSESEGGRVRRETGPESRGKQKGSSRLRSGTPESSLHQRSHILSSSVPQALGKDRAPPRGGDSSWGPTQVF